MPHGRDKQILTICFHYFCYFLPGHVTSKNLESYISYRTIFFGLFPIQKRSTIKNNSDDKIRRNARVISKNDYIIMPNRQKR